MACTVNESNSLGTEDITEENKDFFVTLEIPKGNFECYYLPTIYEIQKEAIILKETFKSPFTRQQFSEEHIAKIEEVRKIFVERKKAEAEDLTQRARQASPVIKRELLEKAKVAKEESVSFPPLFNFKKSMSDLDSLIGSISRAFEPGEKQRLYDEYKDILSKGVITPKTSDKNGETLLYYAIEAKNVELIEELWPLSDPKATTGMYPEGGAAGTTKRYGYFSKACATGDKRVVDLIISKIDDIEECRKDLDEMTKSTGLILAAQVTQDPELIRELITKIKIAVNQADKYGTTPLMYVARRNKFPTQLEILDILLKAGANLEARNPDGETTLSLISVYGEAEVVKFLLEKGANVNTFDSSLVTPLYYAATANLPRADIVEILISHGAKLYKFGKKVGNNGSDVLINILKNEIERNMEINWKGEKVDKLGMYGINDTRRAIIKQLEKMPEEELPAETVPRPAVIVINKPENEPVRLGQAQQNRRIYLQRRGILLRQGKTSANADREAKQYVKNLRSGVLNRKTRRPGMANRLRQTVGNSRTASSRGPATVRAPSVARGPATARGPTAATSRVLRAVANARAAQGAAPLTHAPVARSHTPARPIGRLPPLAPTATVTAPTQFNFSSLQSRRPGQLPPLTGRGRTLKQRH